MNFKEIGLWIILAGLALLFCWLGGLIFLFLLPLPLAFLLNRQGGKSVGVAAAGLAGLLLLLYGLKWISLIEAVFLAGQIIFLGWLLGWLLKQQKNYLRGLGSFLAAAAGLNLLFFLLAFWWIMPQEFAAWNQEMAVYLQQSLKGYAELTQGQISDQAIGELVQWCLHLIPSMLLIYSLFLGLITWNLAYRGLKNWKLPVCESIRFSRWHLPWPSIWVVIPGLAIYLLGWQFGQSSLHLIGANWLYVCGFIFGLAGLSLVIYLNQKWRVAGFFKFLLVVFLIINGLFMILLPILGILDALLDWRRKLERKGE